MDVEPDGNCGYRSFAAGFGMHQNNWPSIRRACTTELEKHKRFWRHILNNERTGGYEIVKEQIKWESVQMAPPSHWIEFPYAGMLLSQAFGVIVVQLSALGSCTYFPMLKGPYHESVTPPNHRIVTLVHVAGIHYIHVVLEGEFPLPPYDVLFNTYAHPDARQWADIYDRRLRMYPRVVVPPQYVDLSSASHHSLTFG
jgi:hypothetical protein